MVTKKKWDLQLGIAIGKLLESYQIKVSSCMYLADDSSCQGIDSRYLRLAIRMILEPF